MKIFPKSDLVSLVTVRHESGKEVTAGEDGQTDGRAGLAPMRLEEDERREKEWTGKVIENYLIMRQHDSLRPERHEERRRGGEDESHRSLFERNRIRR
jgi:hypothetical protein